MKVRFLYAALFETSKKNNDGKTFILFSVVLLFHRVVLDVISRQPRYFFFLFLIFEDVYLCNI